MSSVTSSTSTSTAYQTGGVPNFQQLKSDFQSLSSALQSGDMTGAQQALAALQKDAPGLFESSSNQSSPSANPIESALASVASAVQSGNLSDAQQAFATLQQSLQTGQTGHHHHHHGQGSEASTADSTASQDSSTSSGVTVGFSAIA